MSADQVPLGSAARVSQLTVALRLVWASVIFGTLSGAVSVTTGLASHSLSVLAVGLGVLADVAGSATLIWRFRAERRQPGQSEEAESRAAIVVGAALAVASVAITIQAAIALATQSRPATEGVTLVAAGISLLVLTPLAYAKSRLGTQMASRALRGDGALSAIGAATSLLAITALVLNAALDWWWADRVAALAIAAIAAAEAWRTGPPGRV